jgi:hypothetical protein
MNARWQLAGWVGAACALAVGIVLWLMLAYPASSTAQVPEASIARYTVVHTEGTNIIVTDNKANTLYFYTIDPGTEPGSDLKLRATLDLTQVGKQVLTPKLLKKAP